MISLTLALSLLGPPHLQEAPDPPAPFEERELGFAGHGGLPLAGTLCLPRERPEGGVPALVLLAGSGPTDRDGNQRPMLVTDLLAQLARGLADAGVATLRYDKRATPRYAPRFLGLDAAAQREFFAFDAFAGDARAALAALRGTEGIDGGRVGFLGHSEGGLIALAVAAELGGGPTGVRALVLAATPGRTLADVLREQLERSFAVLPESTRAKLLAEVDRAVAAVVETGSAPADLDKSLAALFPPSATLLLQAELALDPAELARRVRGPVLLLQGEKDVQVSAERDLPRLREALEGREDRGDGACEVALVPGASHNLKPVGERGDPGFTGPVAPEALERLIAWARTALAE